MNKAARMLLLQGSHRDDDDRERHGSYGVDTRKKRDYDRDGYRDGKYPRVENRYGGADDIRRYDGGRYDGGSYGGAYSDDWEPEAAFRDRRGRRHYDNGRYAPMDMAGNYPYSPVPIRRYPIQSEPGMNMWPNEMPYDDPERDPYRGTYMGFMNHHKGYDFEGEGKFGDMRGYAKGRVMPASEHEKHKEKVEPLSEEEVEEWVSDMENVDGSKGKHYSMEQAEKLMKQYNIDCDPIDFLRRSRCAGRTIKKLQKSSM